MKRFPLLPTLLVAAAVATMIGLGIWQLGRAEAKDALARQYARNRTLPAMALPTMGPLDESLLYRRASAFCLEVTGWRRTGGKSADGRSGTRLIADCRTGAEGPGFAAEMGVSADPRFQPHWRGGEVAGAIVAEPSTAGIWARLTGRAPPRRPMLVVVRPAPGLAASAPPAPDAANSSRFYAGQWFFFAAAAALIYGLALRRRRKGEVEQPGAGA